MKKNIFALCILSISMASCIENDGNHLTVISYPGNGDKTLFADQTADSLRFTTFDNWTLDTVYTMSDPEQKLVLQLNPSDMAGEVPKNSWVNRLVNFTFSPNTSNKERAVRFRLNSYKYTLDAVYRQLPYLQIERPNIIKEGNTYVFELRNTAETERDSVIFTTHSNWTLQIKEPQDASWFNLEKTEGEAGKNTSVRINLSKNTSEEKREATLILTSNSASTEIKMIQEGKKE